MLEAGRECCEQLVVAESFDRAMPSLSSQRMVLAAGRPLKSLTKVK
jgi:hypothetical protein